MNKKNTLNLFKEFPELFRNRDNLQESLMAFGFMCGDSWFNLVHKLCQDIQRELDKDLDPSLKEDVYVLEVKEKFGGLRFYITCGNDAIFDLIDKAEEESYKICEICGAPGANSVAGGWYQTLCVKHRKIKGAVVV